MTVTSNQNKRRNLSTSWKVAASDKIARQAITIGGLATIAAVLLVVFVLFSNVLPLFRSATISTKPIEVAIENGSSTSSTTDPANDLRGRVLHSGVDEFSEIAWFLRDSGDVVAKAVHDGSVLAVMRNEKHQPDSSKIVCSFRDRSGNQVLFGTDNGFVQAIEFKYETSFIKLAELEPTIAEAFKTARNGEELIAYGDSTYRKLRGQLVRKQRLAQVLITEPHQILPDGSSLEHLSATPPKTLSSFDQSTEVAFVASSQTMLASGMLQKKVNQFSGAASLEWSSQSLALGSLLDPTQIASLMIHQQGNLASVCLRDGQLARFQITASSLEFVELAKIQYADSSQAAAALDVSTAAPLLGDNTLLIGSKDGRVVGTFLAEVQNPDGTQATRFFGAHPFELGDASIQNLAASSGSRVFAALDDSSQLFLCYAPNDAMLVRESVPVQSATEIWFTSNQDKIGILGEDRLSLFDLQLAYPEASYKSFFQPMWYEGYAEPVSIWQSSSAGVDAEPKLSMRPLIFGTLKATFYSLLIAVPLALMAAVYSSEFLSRPVRLRVKPAIELMAGVPSVVLGFVAALVLASLFRDHLFAILLSLFTLIFTLGLAGNLWLLLPQQIYLRMERFRTLILLFVVPLGIWMAWFSANSIESRLFTQSLIWWLDAKGASSAWPGWFMLMLPLSMIGIAYFSATLGTSLLRPLAARTTARFFAVLMVIRYLLTTLAILLVAALLAFVLTAIGWDPRGAIYGTYQERNALLVGAILGFAIIPIIYTIAEDALQAVPQHLRSASLGCGATPWQTTTRIVLPTAMSGLFGGIMIGFGRAVGETMVVLMAAGNTPVMDMNPFNGYRTLSATLATELPEAAKASTHFHTLFLAAFLLFCFTLVANTLAEFVRMRFRKRSFQL